MDKCHSHNGLSKQQRWSNETHAVTDVYLGLAGLSHESVHTHTHSVNHTTATSTQLKARPVVWAEERKQRCEVSRGKCQVQDHLEPSVGGVWLEIPMWQLYLKDHSFCRHIGAHLFDGVSSNLQDTFNTFLIHAV